MTPAQILALVRDLAVLVALGFVVYLLIKFGEDRVTAKDMKAVQAQLVTNAATQVRWQKEAADANSVLTSQMAATAVAVSAQRAPVVLRLPASGGAVSAAPVPPTGQAAATGGSLPGPGGNPQPGRDVDVRPAVNAFEVKYEDALATCRSVLAQWPQ